MRLMLAAVLVMVGWLIAQPMTAQAPALPFRVGDTVTLNVAQRDMGKCAVSAIVGDFIQCAGKEQEWWNLRALLLVKKER